MPVPLSPRRRFHPHVRELEGRLLPSTFTVLNTDDAGPGSLRQAILDNNGTPGLNSIAFQIGEGGVQTIRPGSALPTITNPVVIDGTTEPGFNDAPLIELSGSAAGRGASGLFINVGGCTVRELVINGFSGGGLYIAGNNAVVQGNYLGTDVTGTRAVPNGRGLYLPFSDATVGGTTAAARNVISGNTGDGILDEGGANLIEGNYIGTDLTGVHPVGNGQDGIDLRLDFVPTVGGAEPGAGNVISGNAGAGIDAAHGYALIEGNYIGTDATGTVPLGNGTGVDIDSSFNQVGGTETGAGNLISGNHTGIFIGDGEMTQVQGNFIGTDVTGTKALGNGIGVQLYDGVSETIGGTAAGAGNLISGNQGDGVLINEPFNLVQGNRIGTDVTGTAPLGNGGNGVEIMGPGPFDPQHNEVGGSEAGAGNIIGFNAVHGVLINGATRELISRNAIFSDGVLGIQLQRNGNQNQAFPTLDSASVSHGHITISGRLQSTPDTAYTLEFFGNDVCNRTGYGEGQRFLGDTVVATDDSGAAAFTVTFSAVVAPGQYVSATATDPANNTSAFSQCVAVSRPVPRVEALGSAVPVTGTADPATSPPTAPGTPQAAEGSARAPSSVPVAAPDFPGGGVAREAGLAPPELVADSPLSGLLLALLGMDLAADVGG